MAYNQVLLIGNLTKDVELRYLPDGQAVGDFSIAINEKYKDKQGNPKESVNFFQVTVWGKTAENCAEYIGKGSKVFIPGKLKQETWEGDDGKKHSRVKIIAQQVQFLSKGKGAGQSQGGGQHNDAGPDDGEPIPF